MKKFFALILIGSVWYLAAMYRSPVLLGLSMTVAVLMLTLFLLPRIQKHGFSAAFPVAAGTMTKGTEEQLEVKSQKRGPMPVARLRYDLLTQYEGEKKPRKLKYVSGCSGSTDQFELPFVPRYSGMMTVRLHKARLYDPLGIFSAGEKQDSSIRIAVLPQMSAWSRVVSRSVEQNDNQPGERPDRGAGTEGDLRQIREWLPGDRPSRIHWNLTARMQETMVREWNEESIPVRTLQLKKDPIVYSAEDADQFYEILTNDVQSVLAKGTEVKVSWKDAMGITSEKMIRETRDLEDLLLELMDSRWLWGGRT